MRQPTGTFAVVFSSLLLSAILAGPHAYGQTVTAAVTGEVSDSTGALIPNASVQVENVNTGVKSASATNASGVYSLRFLPIGRYRATVTATGFTAQSTQLFDLEINQTLKLDVHLAIGNQTTVNVDTTSAILDTNDATLGTTFTANAIENIPLNGLDFSALTLYLPGSVDTAGVSGTTSSERSTQYTDTPNMNGNRAQANNYTLDGIDMNETFNNLIAYSPAPESLQEIRVLTANSPADYGNVNGGGVVSVLKSGTNHYHGSAYGYDQNANFNANSWQNKNQGIAKNTYSLAQFGGTFGGFVKRDKLFFFVDYLGSRYHQGGRSPSVSSVLTPAMRTGDFSILLQQPTPIQLYDSQNNFAPYINNQIPILNPVAKFLIAHPELYPVPNSKATDGIAGGNLQGPSRTFNANNQGDVKLEYTPRNRDRFTAFYSMSTAYDGSVVLLPITFPGTNLFPTKLGGLTWVHTFTPALINSARIGFTRTTWNQGLPGDPSGLFGLGGDAKVGIPFGPQQYVGFSNQGIGSGFSNVGTPAFDGGFTDNTFSYIENLTWQHGRHLVSAGVQALRYQNNYPTSNNDGFLGTLGYNGQFTSNPAAAVTNGPGYAAADFVLDRVSTAQVTLNSINVGQRQWRIAGFLQDDYKLTSRLTLNAGIRYEVDQPWFEQNGKTGNVDLTTGQVIYAGKVPAGAPAGSGVCSNPGCYKPNYKQIMPRIGFAYQASNRFVVRGGYGATSFYEGNSSNQRLTASPPFIQAVNITALGPTLTPTPTQPAGGTPRRVEDGFKYTDPSNLSASGSFSTYPQNIQPAYVQEFNLTLEYALTRTLALQAGYLGETGQHIEDYGNANQFKVNGDQTTAPFYNNPNFGTNGLLVTESRAMMNFNAMEATLRERTSHGLEFTLNYTYSKAMTNSLGNYGLQVNGYSGAFQNYYDSGADYGPAGYDVRHNVSGTGVYTLPVGHGKEYLSHTNFLVDELVGGWKLGVSGVGYSGFPETLTAGNSNSNSYGNNRANQYRQLKIVNSNPSHWFGTDPSATPCLTPGVDDGVCAFGVPANNAFGTSRNGAVRGPGYLNVDTSAFKEFGLFREQTLGFRFDAFNVLNKVSYGNPDTGITNTTFGYIAQQNSIRSVERRLQFSAKYRF